MINVELTAGGGGKGDSRLAKLKERNKTLSSQRVSSFALDNFAVELTVLQKAKSFKSQASDNQTTDADQKSQRYSTTSGADETPNNAKRTWTVGDVEEGKTHRGGKKHVKKKSKTKEWSSGANSIPVG
jgi:nucleolar protein 6